MLSARLQSDKWADSAARVPAGPRRNVNQCRSHPRSLIYEAARLNTECESIPQLMLYATTESHAKKETQLTREPGEHTAIWVKLDGREKFIFGISGMRVRKKGKSDGRRSECSWIEMPCFIWLARFQRRGSRPLATINYLLVTDESLRT